MQEQRGFDRSGTVEDQRHSAEPRRPSVAGNVDGSGQGTAGIEYRRGDALKCLVLREKMLRPAKADRTPLGHGEGHGVGGHCGLRQIYAGAQCLPKHLSATVDGTMHRDAGAFAIGDENSITDALHRIGQPQDGRFRGHDQSPVTLGRSGQRAAADMVEFDRLAGVAAALRAALP
ncbi:hypothetical protein [Massilia eurypsychrophila]|uniref:hypothetical protein n=1 Tax=Massilia eurypsychrophila TaxID=1485217 RepID=UPI001E64F6BC|nr:hypothetical protein [Massilia eurypsychrophila]